MSKRRINKRQSTRIQKIQSNYHQDNYNPSLNKDGLVLSRYSSHAEIETPDGQRYHCSIRPHIDSLVAGDRVIWQTEGEQQGVIVSYYPRHAVLGRPNKRGENKIVAANITQLMIVAAVIPELSWPLIDSYLVMAEHLQVKACIILNKVDIFCDPIKQELLNHYQALGYPILFISNKENIGYEHLKDQLRNETSVFVGQSGVGKSSLISQILPEEGNIQTGEISAYSQLGCHTTSSSRFYHLPQGGALIDSPGVRDFSLWKMPINEIIFGFREFRSLVTQCKFRNCTHQDTPFCEILRQVKAGQVSQKRYENLIKMIGQLIKKSP